MIRNYLVTLIKTVASYCMLELSSFVKFSFILGSKRLFFSAINITGPLLGHYNGIGSFLLLLMRKKFTSFYSLASCMSNGLFNPLVYSIPTIIASGYWFGSHRFIRMGLPILCMALFIVHPIGREAFFYSLYWLIPLIVHMMPVQMAFTEALGTTFLAHGIGSVLMLYCMPMSAEYWLGLMPVVIIERLLFASGMTALFYGAQWGTQLWHSHKNSLLSHVGVTKKI